MVAIWGSYSPNLRWPTHKGRYRGTLMPWFLEQPSLLKACALAMNARSHHKLSRRTLQIIYKNRLTLVGASRVPWFGDIPSSLSSDADDRRHRKKAEVGWLRLNHIFQIINSLKCALGGHCLSRLGVGAHFCFWQKSAKSISISHNGFAFVRLHL